MPLTSPHLPAVGLVSELSKDDRDTLSSYGSFHLTEGEPHGKLFFIINGLLHARCNDNGHVMLLGTINQGEWVGEIDLFDPASAICSVVAIETAQYWVISRVDLEDYINNYPQAGIQLLIGLAATLSRRLRGTTHKLVEQKELASSRDALSEN